MVYAVRRSRAGETKFKLATAAAFYRVLRGLGAMHLRPDAGDFRLMSRASLDALLALPETHRFLRGMVGWVGFTSGTCRTTATPVSPGRRSTPSANAPPRHRRGRVEFDAAAAVPVLLALAATALATVAVAGTLAFAGSSLGAGGGFSSWPSSRSAGSICARWAFSANTWAGYTSRSRAGAVLCSGDDRPVPRRDNSAAASTGGVTITQNLFQHPRRLHPVSRRSSPWNFMLSLVWSMPQRWSIVAWRSRT